MKHYTMPEICLLLLCALPGETPQLGIGAYRKLMEVVRGLETDEEDLDRELTASDLRRYGVPETECREIMARLERQDALMAYLRQLSEKGISLITRISPEYPHRIRERLGDQAPLYLYCVGNLQLFQTECISLVGSRKLREVGHRFSRAAGTVIAKEGYTYCSGGADGADTVGYESAAAQGGSSVIFLASSLLAESTKEIYAGRFAEGKLLLVSEYGFDQSFSISRAMSRNRLIHALGQITLIAQSDYETGGTWNGTIQNLRKHWSPCFICGEEPEDDGVKGLVNRGCTPILLSELHDLSNLNSAQLSFF